MQRYDPVKLEKDILEFWDNNKVHEKANEKNKGKAPFYFLDGPPYTSGKIHLGTAWNKSLKDSIIRYKRMQGFDVWDRAGYDMHGLPTEGKVQKKLDMKTKEEILRFGLDKFIQECKDWAVSNMKIMNKDFKRLGVWMDFDNAYQSIKNEYIEGTWWLVKRAHEKGRLYEGEMTMTWCGSCQTALAKHELEYKTLTDNSIFVKFKIEGKPNEYLVIWTTTPWTIPFNLGVMANPQIDYVKAKVGTEVWILARDLAKSVIEDAAGLSYEIIDEMKGSDLKGLKYLHPFQDMLGEHYDRLKKKSDKVFSVVLSDEYVTLDYGSGLVHMAPGCGPEDYEIGHREGIPPFNELNENGIFSQSMKDFSGLKAKADDARFIEALEDRGAIVAKTEISHEYAHCWRCKEPVIYRTTTQWFFKVEDLIPKMRELNKTVKWNPDWAGSNQFDSWLENLRDNGITRQRFWGSPLPVWRCDKCDDYAVVESRKELKKLGAHVPDDLHKPWIDEVTFECKKCKGTMSRIPDIMDVWIDAGTASWSCLDFPHRDDLYNKLYPPDFILEGKDQIRGWFNLLFVASMLTVDNIAFKACYMHGFINDALGRKMSKSLGNVISPYEIVDKDGADTFRYYMIGGANPGLDINYNFEDLAIKRRNLDILWNLHNFIVDISKTIEANPKDLAERKPTSYEERYIFSKLHSSIKKVTQNYDSYNLDKVPSVVEDLFLELSRTYIQMTREKVNSGTDEEKEEVLYTVYTVFMDILKLFSPVAPFITEGIYLEFRTAFGLEKESIHLYDWPKYSTKLIDEELERDIFALKDIVQSVLNARERAQLGIRWPIAELVIETNDEDTASAIKHLRELIKIQTNVKDVVVTQMFEKAETKLKLNFKTIGPEFGKLMPKITAAVAKESDKALLSGLKTGGVKLKIDGTDVELKDSHFVKEKIVPENYVQSDFGKGTIYISKDRTPALDAEGFSREFIRRVQQARKNAKLQKTDVINLYVRTDGTLANYLGEHKDFIKKRTGSRHLEITDAAPKESYPHTEEDNIKGMKFEIFFSVKGY